MKRSAPLHIALTEGRYDRTEALDLLTRHVHAQIAFLENHIGPNSSEEDIKHVERRIARLQQDFFEIKQLVLKGGARCQLQVHVVAEPE
jgi:cob(I)alamin adenosyltransferase